MILDEKLIGYAWEPFDVYVERNQAITFATALGEEDPVYFDRDAAISAGYRDVVVLPTFPIALSQTQVSSIYHMLKMLEVDPASVLHGSQKFVYHRLVCVGDRLIGRKELTGLYQRKSGSLNFIETVVRYRDHDENLICEDHCTLVSRVIKGKAA